jgi:hypothetical protein
LPGFDLSFLTFDNGVPVSGISSRFQRIGYFKKTLPAVLRKPKSLAGKWNFSLNMLGFYIGWRGNLEWAFSFVPYSQRLYFFSFYLIAARIVKMP